MGGLPSSPNGNTPLRGRFVKGRVRAGRMSRGAAWLVNVATPKLLPDPWTARLRHRARNADNWLEQAARRSVGRQVDRRTTDPDGDTR